MKHISLEEIYEFQSERKQQGFVKSDLNDAKLPIIVIDGRFPGKTVLITAGIHGGEYTSIQAVQKLADVINPDEVNGKIILIPLVNEAAFYHRKPFLSPIDQKNLNRCFPGKKNGSFSERLAYFLTQNFISRCDYYIDCHGGDLPEKLLPHLYYSDLYTDDERAEQTSEMTKFVDVPFKIFSQAEGGAYQAAAALNVPSLLLERGDFGEIKSKNVTKYVEDLTNILRGLNFLQNEPLIYSPALPKDVLYIYAKEKSCWEYFVTAGEFVKQGEVIGKQLDIFGNFIREIRVPKSGTVLYHSASYSVNKEDILFALVV